IPTIARDNGDVVISNSRFAKFLEYWRQVRVRHRPRPVVSYDENLRPLTDKRIQFRTTDRIPDCPRNFSNLISNWLRLLSQDNSKQILVRNIHLHTTRTVRNV